MMRQDVHKKLIKIAKRGETITYGELMKEFGIARGGRKPKMGIGWIVGEISGYENAKSRPLLSAIVVKAGSKTKVCSQGHPGGVFLAWMLYQHTLEDLQAPTRIR
jgi:hypothetical protein